MANKFGHENQNRQYENKSGPDFTLNHEVDGELYGKKAEEWAKAISGKTKNNQLRNFYDKILELYEKAQNLDDPSRFGREILPFIKMLGSKVVYAKSRDNIDQTFADFMTKSLKQIEGEDAMQKFIAFKHFYEAMLGYRGK